jgi:hypothetical protein
MPLALQKNILRDYLFKLIFGCEHLKEDMKTSNIFYRGSETGDSFLNEVSNVFLFRTISG